MSLSDRGWQVFPAEPATIDWARSVSTEVSDALKTTERRHGATWAPGVDLLKNDASGAVAGGVALVGEALVAAQSLFGPLPLHAAQISAVWPGYPKQDPEESDANHRYRRARDAAHIDGLLPEGPYRRRHLREPHAWILGIGLTDTPAAPLVDRFDELLFIFPPLASTHYFSKAYFKSVRWQCLDVACRLGLQFNFP